MFRKAAALDVASRAALSRVVGSPKFELIPLKNVDAQTEFLPASATVTVTASPAKGIEATVQLSARLAERGFQVIPHLSARMIRDRAHLDSLLATIRAAGIERVFVVGGDAEQPGAFPDGLALLRAMAEAGPRLSDIGIPCYPQGHPTIPDAPLLAALADKQPFATSMTTQLCFDARAIRTWLAARRADGIELPVYFGIPGVADLHKLVEISARIGVRDSRRFLAKNTALVGRVLRPGGYRPDGLLAELAPLILDPAARVAGLHLYTFNQVETTEEWRQAYLAGLAEPAGPAEPAEPAEIDLGRLAMALEGRVAIITGATGVLGRVVVERFAAAGCRVVLVGTNPARLKALASDLGLADDAWLPVVGNLREPVEARAVADAAVGRFERLDVLVHLVGGWVGGTPVVDLDPDELSGMLDQHLWTTLNMVQSVVPAMVEAGWGRVVAIMARSGLEASPKVASYAIAKAAEDTLLRTLAHELAGTGVTANLVTVGTIDEKHERDTAPTPRNATWTTPEEIAAAIAYLCSEDAGAISGTRVALDRKT